MTAAIALAIVLVIAVAGASMAMESQRAGQPGAQPRPVRPARPGRAARAERPADPDRSRRPLRPRARPVPESAAETSPAAPPPTDPEPRGPELLRSGTPGRARVISVIDERTIGPVTRSRLTLRVEPEGADPFEVTVRHAFPTPDSRSQVKVGGTIPVRYDIGERRVVVDVPTD